MLIQKGGIYRNIDEANLQIYKDRGYAAVEEKTAATDPVISDLVSRAEKLKLKLADGLTVEQVRTAVEQAEAEKAAKEAAKAETPAPAADPKAGATNGESSK